VSELPLDREDVLTIMERSPTFAAICWRFAGSSRRTMKRKRKRMSPDERRAWEARAQETLSRLESRIAYHRARLAEERRAAGA
jgi:hypothetical protein